MPEKSARHAFYEKVLVNSRDPNKEEVDGQLGAVLGRTETDDGQWYYTVHVYLTGTSWCFLENELSATGQFARREDFYRGNSVRVAVDAAGRGRIIVNPEEGKRGSSRDTGDTKRGELDG